MGTRAQVFIKDTGVYLYQHWEGNNLANTVKEAISRGERLDDVEYLTRIIFSEMIKDSIGDSTGYGIGTKQHSDIEYLITIDCERQIMSVLMYFENTINVISFEEILKGEVPVS